MIGEDIECDLEALETVILFLYTGIVHRGGDLPELAAVLNDESPGSPDLTCNLSHVYNLASYLEIPELCEKLCMEDSIDVFGGCIGVPDRDDLRAQFSFVMQYAESRNDRLLLASCICAAVRRTGSINILLYMPFAHSQDTFDLCIEVAEKEKVLLWSPLVLVMYVARFSISNQWLRNKAQGLGRVEWKEKTPFGSTHTPEVYYSREGVSADMRCPRVVCYNDYGTGFCEPPAKLHDGAFYSEFLRWVRMLQLRLCGDTTQLKPRWMYNLVQPNIGLGLDGATSRAHLEKQTNAFFSETHMQEDACHNAAVLSLKTYEATRDRARQPSVRNADGHVAMSDPVISAISEGLRMGSFLNSAGFCLKDVNARKRKFASI